jgi:hypothetical protein
MAIAFDLALSTTTTPEKVLLRNFEKDCEYVKRDLGEKASVVQDFGDSGMDRDEKVCIPLEFAN